MSVIRVKNGRDIRLKGAAAPEITEMPLPPTVAICPPNFRGSKFRVLAGEGDHVQKGAPILEDKAHTDIKIVAPASGTLSAITRGAKRALLEVVIKPEGDQIAVQHETFPKEKIKGLQRDHVVAYMMKSGLWPVLRRRPFSFFAAPTEKPKSIFVHAMNTEPLAINLDKVVEGREMDFQTGLEVLGCLTEGKVHLCYAAGSKAKGFAEAKGVEHHQFAGAHPTGNVSTHIYHVDRLKKGEVVWYAEVQDVIRLGRTFLTGQYDASQMIAVTGEKAPNRFYARTIIGTPVRHLVGDVQSGVRYISGSVLSGTRVAPEGYVGYYDSQVTAIPEGGQRRLLGWLTPGFQSYTFSNAFASAFVPIGEASLDADENGSHRAIVLNHLYDKYNTIDIMTYFLLRAVISGDIEEAERLGILECEEEDFALATFACPSKTDVGGIIRKGLDLIAHDG